MPGASCRPCWRHWPRSRPRSGSVTTPPVGRRGRGPRGGGAADRAGVRYGARPVALRPGPPAGGPAPPLAKAVPALAGLFGGTTTLVGGERALGLPHDAGPGRGGGGGRPLALRRPSWARTAPSSGTSCGTAAPATPFRALRGPEHRPRRRMSSTPYGSGTPRPAGSRSSRSVHAADDGGSPPHGAGPFAGLAGGEPLQQGGAPRQQHPLLVGEFGLDGLREPTGPAAALRFERGPAACATARPATCGRPWGAPGA